MVFSRERGSIAHKQRRLDRGQGQDGKVKQSKNLPGKHGKRITINSLKMMGFMLDPSSAVTENVKMRFRDSSHMSSSPCISGDFAATHSAGYTITAIS